MSRRGSYLAASALTLILAGVWLWAGRLPGVGQASPAGRAPRIHPDYAGVTMPPNIAPLNFVVDEPGRRALVRVSGAAGGRVEAAASDGRIRFPIRQWHALLNANRGKALRFEVFVQDARARWRRFDPFESRVAREPIDGYLVYRLLGPVYNQWGDIGIYQRNLTSFEEHPLMRNGGSGRHCMNCHTFLKNSPDTFLFHARAPVGPAMVIVHGNTAERIDTRTPTQKGAAGYPAWHPSGRYIACAINRVCQFFHTTGAEPREVVDLDSDLMVYATDSRKHIEPPSLRDNAYLETFPTWSPDGRYLYFVRTPCLWKKRVPMPFPYLRQVFYDLVRIPFDPATGRWGSIETVLTAKQVGKSIVEPRISPDGRFALVCVCDYGQFPLNEENADLALIDLRAPGYPYRRLDDTGKSPRDTWHSWSSNGRWFVASRKKDCGLLARPYLRYVDADGHAAKPLMLPQEDPTYYERCTNTYNLPELITGPVRTPPEVLERAVRGE